MITWAVNRNAVDSILADDIDALLDPDPGQWVVTCGFRSQAQQAIEWQKGRDDEGFVVDRAAVVTDAKPGESPHNFGRAVDVTLIVDGHDVWAYQSSPDWQRLFAAVKAHPRLHSGINFPSQDGDHIEQLHWQALSRVVVAGT